MFMYRKVLLLLFACLTCLPISAQEQYRSKVLDDPDNQLGENAVLSIQDLESKLSSMNDAYAKSSTERYLARHYLQNKEYDKAIAFYENALKEQGLSQYANIEMLQELLQVKGLLCVLMELTPHVTLNLMRGCKENL